MSRTGPRFQITANAPRPAKCAFCLEDATLSREHLFSQPICDVFDIDRASTTVYGFDGVSKNVGHGAALSQRSVKLPCRTCNNTWMSKLEQDTAGVFERFLQQGQELSEADVAVIGRWAAKTLVVFMWAELVARKFMTAPGVGAIPDVTAARSVFAGHVPDNVTVAAGRLAEPNAVLWSAGNPNVITADRNQINCRVVNAAALNLGLLQLWVLAPLFKPSRLSLPNPQRPCFRAPTSKRCRSLGRASTSIGQQPFSTYPTRRPSSRRSTAQRSEG